VKAQEGLSWGNVQSPLYKVWIIYKIGAAAMIIPGESTYLLTPQNYL